MPTPPVAPSICRWRILGALANSAPWGVRLYTLYTGATPTAATMLAIAEDVAAAWQSHCAPFQTTDTTITECTGEDLSSAEGYAGTAVVSNAGGEATTPVDNQVAAVVKFNIDRRYRGGKPKMYVPGIASTYQEDSAHWSTTFVNAFSTAFTAFADEVTAISETGTDINSIVNVSYYKNFTVVTNPITGRARNVPTYRGAIVYDLVDSYTTDLLFGSQRRRRIG